MTSPLDVDLVQVLNFKDLAAYIEALRIAIRDNPEAFENVTLDSYLGALSGFTSDMDGYFLNQKQPVPDQPSWRLIAQMLAAATIYE
jgi:hypothetical protein